VFGETAAFLRKFSSSISSPNLSSNIQLPGRTGIYNINKLEDFDAIQAEFVARMNLIGVAIDKSMLNYMLMQAYPNAQNIQEAFRQLFIARDEHSIHPFIKEGGVLDKIQEAFDKKNFALITQDISSNKDRNASGSNLYSENGFIKYMSLWYGRYRAAAQEMMTIGPENTKMYMFAQNHTMSDITYDLQQAEVDKEGNVSGSETLSDLKDVQYVSYIDKNGRRRGSVIVKTLMDPTFNPNHNKLSLANSSGIKRVDSRDGGTKYVKMTAREDYLSKAEILSSGAIIFPTLSGKSTWFYLRGI